MALQLMFHRSICGLLESQNQQCQLKGPRGLLIRRGGNVATLRAKKKRTLGLKATANKKKVAQAAVTKVRRDSFASCGKDNKQSGE